MHGLRPRRRELRFNPEPIPINAKEQSIPGIMLRSTLRSQAFVRLFGREKPWFAEFSYVAWLLRAGSSGEALSERFRVKSHGTSTNLESYCTGCGLSARLQSRKGWFGSAGLQRYWLFGLNSIRNPKTVCFSKNICQPVLFLRRSFASREEQFQ